MSKPSKVEADQDIIAAEWVIRRQDGLQPHERAEFDRWLGEEQGNWRAFKESDRIWSELAAVDLRGVDAAPMPARRRALPAFAAIAATLVVGVFGAVALDQRAGRTFETSHGEVSTVRLSDGTRVTLGADSRIQVRFNRDGRHVQLRSGEAVFDVAHDASRPFDVRAADTKVTVLGTRFLVKSAPQAVRVDVIQGVVRVSKSENALIDAFAPPPPAEKILRGERLESRGRTLAALPPIDPANVAPWTHGRLVYENASLAEVVADLNRYSPTRVQLGSKELGDLRVTAALSDDQVAEFVASLPVTLPVTLDHEADGGVVIRPAA